MGRVGLGLAVDAFNILITGRGIQSTEHYLEKFKNLRREDESPEMPRTRAVSSGAQKLNLQPQSRKRPSGSSGTVTTRTVNLLLNIRTDRGDRFQFLDVVMVD